MKSTLNIHWKGWYWSWNSSTLATWFKELAQQKNPDSGKDWGQKRATENEMVGWYHQLRGHALEQTPRNSERQGSLMCCSLWGLRAGHDWVTEREQQSFDSPDYAPMHGAIKFWEWMKPFNDCENHKCLLVSSYPVCKDKDTMWVRI